MGNNMRRSHVQCFASLYWDVIRPNVLSFVLGQSVLKMTRKTYKFKRRLMHNDKRIMNIFVAVDDVQSFVALQCAKKITKSYDNIDVRIRILEPQLNGWSSSLETKYDWVFRDSSLFCSLYSLEHPRKPCKSPERLHRVTRILATRLAKNHHDNDHDGALSEALAVMKMAWEESPIDDYEDSSVDSEEVASMLRRNRKGLRRLGYYNPGALEFEGEWYPPGRLDHLERRLHEEDLSVSDSPSAPLLFDRGREGGGGLHTTSQTLPSLTTCPPRPTVELFYSFRSPYSQLVMPRLRAICDRLGADISVRPVLPMVTRGLKVPREKEWYIGKDAVREARKLGLPMGNIADPCEYFLLISYHIIWLLTLISPFADCSVPPPPPLSARAGCLQHCAAAQEGEGVHRGIRDFPVGERGQCGLGHRPTPDGGRCRSVPRGLGGDHAACPQ